MEARIGGLVFFSTFDSGNLGRVEIADPATTNPNPSAISDQDDSDFVAEPKKIQKSNSKKKLNQLRKLGPTSSSSSSLNADLPGPAISTSNPNLPADQCFDIWTKKDCEGTSFENGSRTWFFFGIKRDHTNPMMIKSNTTTTIRLNVRNLNKQSKLFSQGMSPVFTTQNLNGNQKLGNPNSNHVPPTSNWERLREHPTFWTEKGQFSISFRLKLDLKQATYVAFTYPYTYKELQSYLNKLEKKYSTKNLDYESLLSKPSNGIYFHRENIIHSLNGRKVDLITLTGVNNVEPEREENLQNLFPQDLNGTKTTENVRPFKFSQKKVVFVSSRVHPGETQSSFVMNGFLKFLLRENDPRSVTLRKKYIFKLIPMLNPDGVVEGHYRTDSRGVNLNRVYANPLLEIHPQIYAARKLLLYAHYGYEVTQEDRGTPVIIPGGCGGHDDNLEDASSLMSSTTSTMTNLEDVASTSRFLRSSINPSFGESPIKLDSAGNWYEMTETSRFSEGDESIADFSVLQPNKEPDKSFLSFTGAFQQDKQQQQQQQQQQTLASSSSSSAANVSHSSPQGMRKPFAPPPPPLFNEEGSDHFDFAAKLAKTLKEPNESETGNLNVPIGGESGVYLYVDIHGHASKRGIFMYGNHFIPMDTKVDSMLLPKLMSINCANFDFPACNFTERNMYLKDRHTGAGKEGSGRVSAYKATGLIYSYTLEANFNTGRVVNSVPMASRDAGRSTPPPLHDIPPKYDPVVYEDAGKGMAISVLDMTESNPWSRLTCSACKNLKGVKEAIKKYIKQNEEASKLKDKLTSPTRSRRNRTISSTSSPIVPKAGKIMRKGKKSSPLKAPASPDSYRPLTKFPRKNMSGSNAQAQSSSKVTLRRSRSIPGTSTLVSILDEPTDKQLAKKTKALPRSKSQSNPNSRPGSPVKRLFSSSKNSSNSGLGLKASVVQSGGVKKKKKKVKPSIIVPAGITCSRKSSDASTISTDLSQSSTRNKSKKGKKKNRLLKPI